MPQEGSAAAAPVAIVTGGAAGIGREAGAALAEAGFAVLCVDLDAARAGEAAAAIVRTGQAAAALACDVAVEESWPQILAAAESLGQLGVLVSNAGIFPRLSFEAMRAADFDRVMAVNLRAAFLGAVHCVPHMTAGGALVFMTSGSGLMSAVANPMQIGFSLYGASKAALDRFALGIAPELAPRGIAVNLLCPGAAVVTEGYARLALGAEAPPRTISAWRVAEAIAFLAGRRPHEGPAQRYLATEYGDRWGQGRPRRASHSCSKL